MPLARILALPKRVEKLAYSYSFMKPAEAKRRAELAGCTGDAWKAKSIQQLWAGMGHIYELQCGDERSAALVSEKRFLEEEVLELWQHAAWRY